MNQEAFQDRIQDYLAGLLEGDVLREFEEHLLAHPEARDTLDASRRLRDRVAAHPRQMQPARDLWPDVARAIREPVVELPTVSSATATGDRFSESSRPHRHRWFERPAVWGGVAVAAALAVALLMVGRPNLGGGQRAPEVALQETGTPFWPAMVRALEAECVAADVRLAASLQGGDEVFSASTLRGLRADLRVLDAAILDLQQALAEHPEDNELSIQLMKTYERKLSVLKQVERAARRV